MKRILFIAPLVALLGTLVLAAPAQADVGCWGDYCSGKDPVATSCANDARTVAIAAIYSRGGSIDLGGVTMSAGNGSVGQVELRWSERCKTNWARLNLTDNAWIGGLIATQDSGYEQSVHTGVYGTAMTRAGVYYTPMIYSPVRHVRPYSWYAQLPGSIYHLGMNDVCAIPGCSIAPRYGILT